MVAPCVTALRHLSTSITQMLGSQQGTKHEPANLTTDIELLMASLAEHEVYKIKGRVFAEGDAFPTPDVISVGAQQLSDSSSNPLVEYNTAFRKLQARCRLRPLVESWSESPAEDPPTIAVAPVNPSQGGSDATGPQAGAAAPAVPAAVRPETPDVELAAAPEFAGSDDGSADGSDDDAASADGLDDDGLTAFERTMDEVNEPTLTRDSAQDVALDMDGGDDDFLFSKSIYENDGDSDSDGYVDDVNDIDYLDDY